MGIPFKVGTKLVVMKHLSGNLRKTQLEMLHLKDQLPYAILILHCQFSSYLPPHTSFVCYVKKLSCKSILHLFLVLLYLTYIFIFFVSISSSLKQMYTLSMPSCEPVTVGTCYTIHLVILWHLFWNICFTWLMNDITSRKASRKEILFSFNIAAYYVIAKSL